VPAAAVIPAPIAYIKVVAVKKLVFEFLAWEFGLTKGENFLLAPPFWPKYCKVIHHIGGTCICITVDFHFCGDFLYVC